MSETSTTTEVASQYAAQVAADLESNAKEQERIGAEVATLQERLTALQHDHNVLVNIQQALAGATSVSAAESTVVPSPSKEVAAEPAGGKRTRTKKDAAKKAPATDAAPKTAATKSSAPTLVDLVRRHLATQHEPRSAAEVSSAVNQAHPERATRTTVVRNTLEGLVAKQQAQRTKQGSSVYYTAISAQEPSAASEPGTEAS
ncbi:hypothetical protein [Streptomyces rubrogriseus]|uniref:hypothetical protein n=1 Tax=Streptomyces rubrogriseus TaxID=194673 RepID=UPI00380E5F09